MTSSTLNITPTTHPVVGAVSNAENHPSATVRDAFTRATDPDYFGWLDHVHAAAGCTRPVRLAGTVHTVERTGTTATVFASTSTADMPDGVIYKPCGNRRARVCPSCSRTYQADAYQLLRAGLIGGKTIPQTVAGHPSVFATFTAPSFGTVHTRRVARHGCVDKKRCDCRPDPCHARRDTGLCEHDQPAVCFLRHVADDPVLGEPLCLDCYDHGHQVVWNLFAGELWRRTKQAIERQLARVAKRRGIPPVYVLTAAGKLRPVAPVKVSHGKVAEFQARGAVHFHTLLRLDGVDPHDPGAIVAPPAGITTDELDNAIRAAVALVAFATPPHPEAPEGWPMAWGEQVDVRAITLTGRGEITDGMVAGYLAKYATKSTEATGDTSTRITQDTIASHLEGNGHIARLKAACWQLGRNPRPLLLDHDGHTNPYLRLRRWAHMLGFGGHFLTKARRYSVTFAVLRGNRVVFRRTETFIPITDRDRAADPGEETTLVVGLLTYAGTGWHTLGDALLANTAAAQARQYARTGREELAHQTATEQIRPAPLAA